MAHVGKVSFQFRFTLSCFKIVTLNQVELKRLVDFTEVRNNLRIVVVWAIVCWK